jgi:hypothetical protein
MDHRTINYYSLKDQIINIWWGMLAVLGPIYMCVVLIKSILRRPLCTE